MVRLEWGRDVGGCRGEVDVLVELRVCGLIL